LPLETLAAEREPAIGRIPNGCNIALRDLIGEEAQVASAARLLALGEGAINRVRNDHRIADAQSVATVARPRIIARGLVHVRANRVQLDVALAGEQIAVRLDDRGAKAPFEKRAGPTLGPVDVLHLALLSQSLHKQRRSPIGCRCHEQVQMIGHAHLGMDPHRLRCRSLDQHAEERPIIGVVEADRGPVDTAQNGVQQKASCDDACVSGHKNLLA
jgi:hypothetical protein